MSNYPTPGTYHFISRATNTYITASGDKLIATLLLDISNGDAYPFTLELVAGTPNTYTIKHRASGKLIQAVHPDGTTAVAKDPTGLASANSSDAQKWAIIQNTRGNSLIQNPATGLMLTGPTTAPGTGTPIFVEKQIGGLAMEWTLIPENTI